MISWVGRNRSLGLAAVVSASIGGYCASSRIKSSIETRLASSLENMLLESSQQQKVSNHISQIYGNNIEVTVPFLRILHKEVNKEMQLGKLLRKLTSLRKKVKQSSVHAGDLIQCWKMLKIKGLTQLCVSLYSVALLHAFSAVISALFGRLAKISEGDLAATSGAAESNAKDDPSGSATAVASSASKTEITSKDKIACMVQVINFLGHTGLSRLTQAVEVAVAAESARWELTEESLASDVSFKDFGEIVAGIRKRMESGSRTGASASTEPFQFAQFLVPNDSESTCDGEDSSAAVQYMLTRAYDLVESPNFAVVVGTMFGDMFTQHENHSKALLFLGKDSANLSLVLMLVAREHLKDKFAIFRADASNLYLQALQMGRGNREELSAPGSAAQAHAQYRLQHFVRTIYGASILETADQSVCIVQ